MIAIEKLNNEAYALKAICLLADRYVVRDADKFSVLLSIASNLDCIPGRFIYRAFHEVECRDFSPQDEKILKEIINLYG